MVQNLCHWSEFELKFHKKMVMVGVVLVSEVSREMLEIINCLMRIRQG